MPDVVTQINDLKGVPDQMLQKELAQPSGAVPAYLVLAEAQRRQLMRQSAVTSQNQPPMGSVYDDVIRSMMARQPPPGPAPAGSQRRRLRRPTAAPQRRRRTLNRPRGWRRAARWMTTGRMMTRTTAARTTKQKGKKQSAISREPTREQVLDSLEAPAVEVPTGAAPDNPLTERVSRLLVVVAGQAVNPV